MELALGVRSGVQGGCEGGEVSGAARRSGVWGINRLHERETLGEARAGVAAGWRGEAWRTVWAGCIEVLVW